MGNKEKLEKAKVNMDYKERLEKAKELYPAANAEQRYVLECLFPELVESEDERIKKCVKYAIDKLFLKEKIVCDVHKDDVIAWLEKQGKESDKSKPKFKVGDWVVTNYGKVNQVIAVDDDGDGFTLDDDTYFSGSWIDGYHLWTIQDAKDGDVLCVKYGNDEMPFMFTGKQDDVAYCALNSFGEFVLSIAEWLLKTSVFPATQEQRDLLFQKMKEAGYEWDAELKKVSKITTPEDVGFEELGKVWAEEANKQILANSAKTCKKSQRMISAEAKEALYDKPATIDIDKMVDDYANNEEFGKPLNCMIRAYRQGLKDAIGKVVSESAWSEEDEEMLDGIILRCEKYGHQEQINWLKSIKQRIKGE